MAGLMDGTVMGLTVYMSECTQQEENAHQVWRSCAMW